MEIEVIQNNCRFKKNIIMENNKNTLFMKCTLEEPCGNTDLIIKDCKTLELNSMDFKKESDGTWDSDKLELKVNDNAHHKLSDEISVYVTKRRERDNDGKLIKGSDNEIEFYVFSDVEKILLGYIPDVYLDRLIPIHNHMVKNGEKTINDALVTTIYRVNPDIDGPNGITIKIELSENFKVS